VVFGACDRSAGLVGLLGDQDREATLRSAGIPGAEQTRPRGGSRVWPSGERPYRVLAVVAGRQLDRLDRRGSALDGGHGRTCHAGLRPAGDRRLSFFLWRLLCCPQRPSKSRRQSPSCPRDCLGRWSSGLHRPVVQRGGSSANVRAVTSDGAGRCLPSLAAGRLLVRLDRLAGNGGRAPRSGQSARRGGQAPPWRLVAHG
jgi:hypothetical protein